jgi:hypothetical protein
MPSAVPTPWWGLSWAWVGGYTSLSTLVVVFNLVLFFSVVTNKYLHYSYNYVLVMLSIRSELFTLIKTFNTHYLQKCVPSPLHSECSCSNKDGGQSEASPEG